MQETCSLFGGQKWDAEGNLFIIASEVGCRKHLVYLGVRSGMCDTTSLLGCQGWDTECNLFIVVSGVGCQGSRNHSIYFVSEMGCRR